MNKYKAIKQKATTIIRTR